MYGPNSFSLNSNPVTSCWIRGSCKKLTTLLICIWDILFAQLFLFFFLKKIYVIFHCIKTNIQIRTPKALKKTRDDISEVTTKVRKSGIILNQTLSMPCITPSFASLWAALLTPALYDNTSGFENKWEPHQCHAKFAHIYANFNLLFAQLLHNNCTTILMCP